MRNWYVDMLPIFTKKRIHAHSRNHLWEVGNMLKIFMCALAYIFIACKQASLEYAMISVYAQQPVQMCYCIKVFLIEWLLMVKYPRLLDCYL